MSIHSLLRTTAKEYPDKQAIFCEGQSISYMELDSQVDNLARGLIDLGLKHQERVGVILGNSPDFIKAYFGITRAGGTIIPFNPLLKSEEIIYILNDANIVILIISKPFVPLVKSIWPQVPSLKHTLVVGGDMDDNIHAFDDLLKRKQKPVDIEISDDDIAACLYTSGTTGKPKGAMLSHGNLIFDSMASMKRMAFRQDDIHLCVLPLFHSFCQMGSMRLSR